MNEILSELISTVFKKNRLLVAGITLKWNDRMVRMKTVLSIISLILLVISVLFGVAYVSARSSLSNTKHELSQAQEQLTLASNDLSIAQTELSTAESNLLKTSADLQIASTDLADKIVELAAAESELRNTKLNLNTVTRQRDAAVEKNDSFTTSYSAIRKAINLRAGEDENGKQFITPKDPAVIQKALEITGAFSTNSGERWADYQRLYEWVVDNIEYNYDTEIPWMPADVTGKVKWFSDFWKMPAETIADGLGDCEDMANLLASLLLSYNGSEYAVWAIKIQNDDSGHLAVALPVVGDQLTIFDPAGYYYSGIYSGYIQSVSISAAISSWLSHWASEMPGAKVTAVFSYDFYKEFDSTAEFIQWAIDRYSN